LNLRKAKVVHFHDPFRFHIIPYFLKNREGLGQNAVAPIIRGDPSDPDPSFNASFSKN
jgi:hypothetical protein